MSHLPPGIPEGTDPHLIVDDGINPPYVASGEPYVPPARPVAAPAFQGHRAGSGKPVKKVSVTNMVTSSISWGLLFIVLFFGGIAAVANSAMWGFIGIVVGLYCGWQIIGMWISYAALKREGEI